MTIDRPSLFSFRRCAIAMYAVLLAMTTYVVVACAITSTWSWAIVTWPMWAISLVYWWRKG